MGTTEFLMEMKLNPDKIHQLLRLITDFTRDWLAYQRECFPTIDGVLLLDDIVGFIGEEDYQEFAQPYLKELFTTLGVSVRFFHNDSPCRASAPHLHDTGINLYNMGIEVTVKDLQGWTDGKVTLMGNIPPRDVLASGTPEDVERAVEAQFRSLSDTRRILFSCGGGMPPKAPNRQHPGIRLQGESPEPTLGPPATVPPTPRRSRYPSRFEYLPGSHAGLEISAWGSRGYGYSGQQIQYHTSFFQRDIGPA